MQRYAASVLGPHITSAKVLGPSILHFKAFLEIRKEFVAELNVHGFHTVNPIFLQLLPAACKCAVLPQLSASCLQAGS